MVAPVFPDVAGLAAIIVKLRIISADHRRLSGCDVHNIVRADRLCGQKFLADNPIETDDPKLNDRARV
jgi:hypothetical protein